MDETKDPSEDLKKKKKTETLISFKSSPKEKKKTFSKGNVFVSLCSPGPHLLKNCQLVHYISKQLKAMFRCRQISTKYSQIITSFVLDTGSLVIQPEVTLAN